MIYKKKTVILLLILLIYNFAINTFYRPYIYKNNIDDYGIADVGNNITFIPGVYCFLYLVRRKYFFSKQKDIVIHFCVLCTIEIISAFVPHFGTFDPKDILGLLIGALLLSFFIKNDK
jgi:hypothetical protein